jgi:hypothetical protein
LDDGNSGEWVIGLDDAICLTINQGVASGAKSRALISKSCSALVNIVECGVGVLCTVRVVGEASILSAHFFLPDHHKPRMSSVTPSSSPGLSISHLNGKRAHSDTREVEDRITKKSRILSEEPGATRDAKDKKKRHKRKKRKVSVVVIEDGRARIKDSRRGIMQSLVPSPIKASESSRSRSDSVGLANDKSDKHDGEEIVLRPIVSLQWGSVFTSHLCFARAREKARPWIHP